MHFTYNLGPPRPYLHPIRTLAGTVITDAEPADHPWHLGLSLAVQDVNGINFWGGRTYVRGEGYVWLDNHGVISHEGFDTAAEAYLVQRLAWRDPSGKVLLSERRTIATSQVADRSWRLDLSWELTPPAERIVLGSPTTNGREYGAGYGGCFLRLAPAAEIEVSAQNGSTDGTITWRTDRYQLQLSGAERWFIRTDIYPGICAAWAFEEVKVIDAGQTWPGAISLVITDL